MTRCFINLAFKNWVEFHNNDTIENLSPSVWFQQQNFSKQFVNVRYMNVPYTVHISQIQFIN